MPFDYEWITCKGTITDDNRDYCSIALRGNEALYCIVDGSSQSQQSGALAHDFAKELADRFVAQPKINCAQSVLSVMGELADSFKTSYPAGRLSFLILLDSGGGAVTTIHIGDCRFGRASLDGSITWLTRAHTLANAIEDIDEEALCQHDDRHMLTRSFRPGKLYDAEIREFSLRAGDRFVMGTDGYWADLDDGQKLDFIAKSFVPSSPNRDDVSCLVLTRLSSDAADVQSQEDSENFYIIKD